MISDNVLTFVVPVRHPENAADWGRLKANLAETVRSIAAQDASGWKAVIAANAGSDLPALPKGFEVAWVDLPPNTFPGVAAAKTAEERQEARYQAIRADKGRRVLAGMLQAGAMGHVMVVDDDDFISRRLTGFVAAHRDAPGWYLQQGYVWSEGTRLLFRHGDFSHLCGTSHIIRAALYGLPGGADEATEALISYRLGSHMFFREELETLGTGLAPLPFVGAIYRTGHQGATSSSRGVLRSYLLRRAVLKRPGMLIGNLARLGLLSAALREEFFGEGTAMGSVSQ